jgi:hypothetical protein
MMDRRSFLQAGAALALVGSSVSARAMRGAKVVVIGGGYGGATAAKYIRLFSDRQIDVTLVEPNKEFVSCPMSNLVIGGSRKIADISRPYATLTKNHGITIAQDYATAIDTTARTTLGTPPISLSPLQALGSVTLMLPNRLGVLVLLILLHSALGSRDASTSGSLSGTTTAPSTATIRYRGTRKTVCKTITTITTT